MREHCLVFATGVHRRLQALTVLLVLFCSVLAAQARRQYEEDLKEAAELRRATLGEWVSC